MICPVNAVIPGEEGFSFLAAEYEALYTCCGHCEVICPTDAITAKYQAISPEDETADTGQISPDVFTRHVQSRRS